MKNLLEIKEQIVELTDLIAAAALKHHDPVADEITERKAKIEFGARWINYHDERNHITWTRKGQYKNSPKITSRAALLALREAEKMGAKALQEYLNK